MVTKLNEVREEVTEDLPEAPQPLAEQKNHQPIDPKTEITVTIEELQTLIQAERLSVLASSIISKINKQI